MNKRLRYRYLTKILRRYYTIYGIDKILSLITDLKRRYRRRPALMNELSNLIHKIDLDKNN